MLLKSPETVILDEATAHLDSESETAVQRALGFALSRRTSIVIAHRLSTILRADQIVVIQEGRIVEHGTHAELFARSGSTPSYISFSSDVDEVIHTVIQIGITHENSLRARPPQPLRRYRQMDRRR